MTVKKTYENTGEGKELYIQILKMLQALCAHYQHMRPQEFVTGIVLGKHEYNLVAGYMLCDETQPKYKWAAQLPEDLQDIPLIIVDRPGISIGIRPRYISMMDMPTL